MSDSTIENDPNPKWQTPEADIPDNKPNVSTVAYVATAIFVAVIVFVFVIAVWLYRRRRAVRRLENLEKNPPPILLQHHIPMEHPNYTPMRSGLTTPLNDHSEFSSEEPAGAPQGRAAIPQERGRSNYGLVPSTSTGSFSGSIEPPSPSMSSLSQQSVFTPASSFAMSMSSRGFGYGGDRDRDRQGGNGMGMGMGAIPEDAPLNGGAIPSSASHHIDVDDDRQHGHSRMSMSPTSRSTSTVPMMGMGMAR